jgi:hypothetical protein
LGELEFLINIKLIAGIYNEITVPILLKLTENYPFEPPYGFIK